MRDFLELIARAIEPRIWFGAAFDGARFGTTGSISQIASASWLFWNAPGWIDTEPPAALPTGVKSPDATGPGGLNQ